MLRYICRMALVAVLAIQLCGCALLLGATVGAGGVVWAKGRLQQEFDVPFDRIHKATISGLKRLELPIIIERKDKMTAKVESKFADGTNVWVDMDYITEHSTRIVIRVGVLGDQERSQKILESIKRYL